MSEDNRPKDTRKFVKEIIEQIDGPDPEELVLNLPATIAVCEHCKEPVVKAAGSAPNPKLLTISEPNRSK